MNDDVSGQFLQAGGVDVELEDDNARFRAAQAQDESESFYENIKTSMAGAVGVQDRSKGAGRALDFLLDAPKNIGVGAYRALVNTIDTAWDFQAEFAESLTKDPAAPAGQQGGVKVPSLTEAFPDLMKNVYGLADQWSAGNQPEDDVMEGIAQFTLPFAGWLKAFGGMGAATKAATVVKAAAAEAVTAASAFDPHEGRFADLLQMGRQLDNRFGEVLRRLSPDGSLVARYIDYMTNRENEGEWHGRFKNAVDSLATTAAIAGFVKAAGKTYKKTRGKIEKKVEQQKEAKGA